MQGSAAVPLGRTDRRIDCESNSAAYDASQDREAKSPVEQILRAGQASGEFRDFDVTVMATMIQRAVDGLPFLLTDDPDFDTRTYAAEVITAFELATRAAP